MEERNECEREEKLCGALASLEIRGDVTHRKRDAGEAATLAAVIDRTSARQTGSARYSTDGGKSDATWREMASRFVVDLPAARRVLVGSRRRGLRRGFLCAREINSPRSPHS